MTERIATLVWLAACAAQAGEPNAVYEQRATWAESMTATRQNVAQLQAKRPDVARRQDGLGLALGRACIGDSGRDWPETDWLMQDASRCAKHRRFPGRARIRLVLRRDP